MGTVVVPVYVLPDVLGEVGKVAKSPGAVMAPDPKFSVYSTELNVAHELLIGSIAITNGVGVPSPKSSGLSF